MIRWIVAAVLAVLLLPACGAMLVLASPGSPEPCATTVGGNMTVTETIYAVGQEHGASDRTMLAAMMTGIVETGSTPIGNPNHGHGTSVGAFQLIAGHGTVAQRMDVRFSANWFFAQAVNLDPTFTGTAGQLAQAVQKSAHPGRYDEEHADAEALLARVTGACAPKTDGYATGSLAWGGYANGEIPTSALAATPGFPATILRPDAAASLAAMVQAAAADGIVLSPGGGYRSCADQWAVYREKPSLASDPRDGCSSVHGWGMAVDMRDMDNSRCGSPEYMWIRVNGPRFGWHQPDWARPGGSRTECWHVEVGNVVMPS